MGYVDAHGKARPPFVWEQARRLTHCTKQFTLYGIFGPAKAATCCEDIRYIYSTFPIVAENETE